MEPDINGYTKKDKIGTENDSINISNSGNQYQQLTILKMLIKEYRICMPMTVEEYRIAQLYMIQKKSREETTGKESGVEIIKNEPYTDGPGGSGQYTFKIYHVGSHLPGWLRSIIPKTALKVEEEAWNAYPYTKTRYRVPFMEKFTLELETKYLDDGGDRDDVFELTPDEKNERIVDFIDIVTDPLAVTKPSENPATYVSEVTGRGPLSRSWHEEFKQAVLTGEKYPSMGTKPDRTGSVTKEPLPKRIMCSYKLCRVNFAYWGMQSKIESFIHDIAIRRTMVSAHRQAWTWQDEWYGLTMAEIRRLEAETAKALAEKMNAAGHNSPVPVDTEVINSAPSDDAPLHTESANDPSAGAPLFGSCMSFNSEAGKGTSMLHSIENSEDEDFFDARSFSVNGISSEGVNASASDVTVNEQTITPIGPEDFRHRLPSDVGPGPTILLFVVHGGCLQDRLADASSKRADVHTFKATLESVISAHFPGLRSRVCVQLVPCPAVASDTLHTLDTLDPLSSTAPSSTSSRLVRSFVPLGCIPLLFTNSRKYAQDLHTLCETLNEQYVTFCESAAGKNFSGCVSVVADNIGSILLYDLLTAGELTSTTLPPSNRHSVSGCNKPAEHCGDFEPGLYRSLSPASLAFDIQDVFTFGSSLGLLLAYRCQLGGRTDNSNGDGPSLNRLSCEQVFNLFHLADPFAYRLEPLLHPAFANIPVIHLPAYPKRQPGLLEGIDMAGTIARNSSLFQQSLSEDAPACVPSATPEELCTLAEQIVTGTWWGRLRIDFGLHCPTGVQNILARALPSLVHSSYWESKDASYFIAHQLAERMECSPEAARNAAFSEFGTDASTDAASTVGSGLSDPGPLLRQNTVPQLASNGSPLLGGLPRNFRSSITNRLRFKSRPADRTKTTNPNHRANDVIVLEGQPQTIAARFAFGSLDLSSLTNDKVEVFARPQSLGSSTSWTSLGSESTDANGRLTFTIPEDRRLGVGMHRLRLVAASDAEHPLELTAAIVPPGADVVISSIDGSFAASLSIMGKDPKVRPGSVDIMRHWQALGYLLIYMSARPDMQHKQVSIWLAQHNFPTGLCFFVDGIFTDPLRQKSLLLTALVQQAHLNVHCAYGSSKDIPLYRSLGLQPHQIFAIGKISRRQAQEATAIRGGYAAHLQDLLENNSLCKPAVGPISSAVYRYSLDAPSSPEVRTTVRCPVFFDLPNEPVAPE
ncbi:Membrane-associated phosphatidylinositol transfer protein 2 [Sparganum proliferum]